MPRDVATRQTRNALPGGWSLLGLVTLVLTTPAARATNEPQKTDQAEAGAKLLLSDSRAPYVHRLTLYDHDGRAIDPSSELPPPYSPRMTCGKCHPYAQIGHGWHFNAPDPDVPAGRLGEPWLWSDDRLATVLPISGRRWPGTYAPSAVGLSNWQFVLRFGGHLPGGGLGEPSDDDVKKSPEAPRWNVSGTLEIDCMFCHSADQQHDPSEAAQQIEAQNFRWSPTAALGLAVVRGEARKAPDDWDPSLPPNPDFPEKTGPKLVYDKTLFDADNRVLFSITRRPSADRCYFCHSFREVGPDAAAALVESRDVHLAAGLTCADCHTNDIAHEIVRGFQAEAGVHKQPERAAYSCEGCHLGSAAVNDTVVVLGGRYRAPHPQHRGLPPVHFEKLACTACHCGPWPTENAHRIQTALAHGLGLATRDRTASDSPQIVGPIFAPQDDGKIAPHRMVWPAFWGSLDGKELKPLPLTLVQKAARNVLPKPAQDAPAAKGALPTESTVKMLKALAADKQVQATPVYVHDGRVYRATDDDRLETSTHATARAYFWPMTHDVRPAAQSLGTRGCTDCHAAGAPMYFGRLAAANDPEADARPLDYMYQVRGDDRQLVQAWNLGFTMRPAFKWLAFVCAGLMTLLLLRLLLDLLTGGTTLPSTSSSAAVRSTGLTRFEHLFHTFAIAGVVIQAVTGFGPKLLGLVVEAWPLFVHMLGAPLLVLGLTGTALQWARRCRLGPATGLNAAQKWLFWLALALGLAVLSSMLLAMLPVIGYAGQAVLIQVHLYSALGLVLMMVLHTVVSLAARRARGKSQ